MGAQSQRLDWTSQSEVGKTQAEVRGGWVVRRWRRIFKNDTRRWDQIRVHDHSIQITTTPSDLLQRRQTNEALRDISRGTVGLDTEFTSRSPTPEEHMIINMFPAGGAALDRKSDELRRILESPNIKKVGIGLIKDINVVWDDLQTDMKHLVDTGMMTSVEDIFGYTIWKELTTSGWVADNLTDTQIRCRAACRLVAGDAGGAGAGAALDAIASLRLHEVLVDTLDRKGQEIDVIIPFTWYTLNLRMGEAMRLKPAADGSELAWRAAECTSPKRV
ncbi:hypothetical protein C8R44DRAFT_745692 [Mycena epipterygia]|nr:hypothetical protein C8R44DRAFT_745692 [Mycena epipterygia]